MPTIRAAPAARSERPTPPAPQPTSSTRPSGRGELGHDVGALVLEVAGRRRSARSRRSSARGRVRAGRRARRAGRPSATVRPWTPTSPVGSVRPYERFVPGTADGELIEVEHLARYRWAAQLVAGRTVLDAGCGVGYGSAMLAGAGAGEVVGLDLSARAIEAARDGGTRQRLLRRRRRARAALRRRDASTLVVCFEVIEHVESPGRRPRRARAGAGARRRAGHLVAQPRRLSRRQPAPPPRVRARGASLGAGRALRARRSCAASTRGWRRPCSTTSRPPTRRCSRATTCAWPRARPRPRL